MNQDNYSRAFASAASSGREVDCRMKNDTVVIVIQGGKVVQFDNRRDIASMEGIDGDGI